MHEMVKLSFNFKEIMKMIEKSVQTYIKDRTFLGLVDIVTILIARNIIYLLQKGYSFY